MGQIVSKKKIFVSSSNNQDIISRITKIEQNEYKITYYEVISGTSGSLTVPSQATINAGEFGLSGNAILSKIDGSNKPTFESPKTAGGVVVTTSLNVSTGAWVASGTYTDSSVALIYSIKIKAIYYSNLTYTRIIETADTGVAHLDSPTFTGTVTTPAIIVSSETASRVAIIDASKNVKSADTATYPNLTELSYAKGVTSAIQSQIDAKAPIASPTFTGTATSPSVVISGTGGSGFVNLANQSSAPSTPASSTQNIYSNSLGKLTKQSNNTQVVTYRAIVYSDVSTSSALTGTTSNTLIKSGLIKANTYSSSATDTVVVECANVKTGTNGTFTNRLYANTSSSLSGATIIATFQGTAANLYTHIVRNGIIKSSSNTEFLSPSTSGATDMGVQGTLIPTTVNIDWTVDQYIVAAMQNASASDSVVCSYLKIYRD